MPDQTDAELIAEVRARRHMNISIRPDPSPTETRSALRVEDVDRLLGVIERQRVLLAESAEALDCALGYTEVSAGRLASSAFHRAWGTSYDLSIHEQLGAAIRSLLEEIRHG